MLQEAGQVKNTVVLIFRHIQCLHLMYSEVAWVLVSSETQVQPQIILDPDYLPDYLSVSYGYVWTYISLMAVAFISYVQGDCYMKNQNNFLGKSQDYNQRCNVKKNVKEMKVSWRKPLTNKLQLRTPRQSTACTNYSTNY